MILFIFGGKFCFLYSVFIEQLIIFKTHFLSPSHHSLSRNCISTKYNTCYKKRDAGTDGEARKDREDSTRNKKGITVILFTFIYIPYLLIFLF